MTILCIISYLCAIIAANGVVSAFGQAALPFTAFVLIPFDLFARDVLHDRWKSDERALWIKMMFLIVGGSLLSWFSSIATPRVSLASALAFMSAGFVDTVMYWLLDKCPRVVKMNGSNAVSAVVDSIIFPLVAFGGLNIYLSATQSVSKFIGGFVWTGLFLLLLKVRRK